MRLPLPHANLAAGASAAELPGRGAGAPEPTARHALCEPAGTHPLPVLPPRPDLHWWVLL